MTDPSPRQVCREALERAVAAGALPHADSVALRALLDEMSPELTPIRRRRRILAGRIHRTERTWTARTASLMRAGWIEIRDRRVRLSENVYRQLTNEYSVKIPDVFRRAGQAIRNALDARASARTATPPRPRTSGAGSALVAVPPTRTNPGTGLPDLANRCLARAEEARAP